MNFVHRAFEEATGEGRLSQTEQAWHAARAAKATDRLLALLIQRHPDEPYWRRYSSRQIAQPGKLIPVPVPIQENPARSDIASDGLALRVLAEPVARGAPITEWLSLQDAIATPVVRLIRSDRPRIEEIQSATARHYGVTRDDIISSRRTMVIIRPRQVAMYLAKVLTLRSYPDIGRRFGNRDHTTVMHSVRKIANLVQSDLQLAADIASVRLLLGMANERAPEA